MTCSHVLGLIDAGPFADFSRAHIDAAWRHARACASCGAALRASRTLTRDLAALPQLTSPPDLAAAVLAQVARVDEERARPPFRATSRKRWWPGWAVATGAFASAAMVLATTWRHGGALSGVTAPGPRGVADGLGPMPDTILGVGVLTACLTLYALGLFATVSSPPDTKAAGR